MAGARSRQAICWCWKGETDAITKALSVFDVSLDLATPENAEDTDAKDDEIVLRELVVQPGAQLVDRSAADIGLRTRFGLNLLALSREGRRPAAACARSR